MNKKIFIIMFFVALFAGIAYFFINFLIKNSPQNSAMTALLEAWDRAKKSSTVDDERDIEYIFEQYKTAALKKDSGLAIKCLSQNTIRYYADILGPLKRGTKKEIQSRSLIDQLMILIVRNNFNSSTISKLNSGEDMLALAFREGLIGEQDLPSLSIRSIKISEETAFAEINTEDGIAPQKLGFIKEGNNWKIDLISIFPESNVVFKSMVKESNLTEEEFIFQTLERQSGIKPDDSIWQPPFPQE